MRDLRLLPRSLALGVALCLVAACERAPAPAARDSAARAADSTLAAAGDSAHPVSTWSADAGPALVVSAAASGAPPGEAAIVLPEYTDSTLTDTARFDADRLRAVQVDLFGRGGLVAKAVSLGPMSAEGHGEGCTAWPAARPAAGEGLAWTVGLATGRAQPIVLDSLAGHRGADSARFAADVARLASALPETGDATFRGLPFVVRTAYRFTALPGVDALAADVMRQVNQEANPRVEHVLLVAERGADGRWSAGYSERSAGAEDDVSVADVLAAFTLGAPPRPSLAIARQYGDGTEYLLIERTAPRQWRVRWTSAYAGC